MLFDPRNSPGQGARYRCPVCGMPIGIKQSGRPRKFCSDSCKDSARREANFRVSGTARYPTQAVTRNPEKTLANSVACKATLVNPRSPTNAPLEVLGHQDLPWPNPPPGNHARLTRNAIATELAVRWLVIGGRGRLR